MEVILGLIMIGVAFLVASRLQDLEDRRSSK